MDTARKCRFEVPASLAGRIVLGDGWMWRFLPFFELIAHPGYLVVDDVAIASQGAVLQRVRGLHRRVKGRCGPCTWDHGFADLV